MNSACCYKYYDTLISFDHNECIGCRIEYAFRLFGIPIYIEREQKPKAEPLINFILDYGAKRCTENTTTLWVGLYHVQLYILSLYYKVIVLLSSTSSS